MMPQVQRETLEVLAEVCDLSPHIRLGQLLAHLGFLGEDRAGHSLWAIDDMQLLDVLYHHRAELLARVQDDSQRPLNPTSVHGVDAGI